MVIRHLLPPSLIADVVDSEYELTTTRTVEIPHLVLSKYGLVQLQWYNLVVVRFLFTRTST